MAISSIDVIKKIDKTEADILDKQLAGFLNNTKIKSLVNKKLTPKPNKTDEYVMSFSDYNDTLRKLEDALRVYKTILDKIPHSLNVSDWSKFSQIPEDESDRFSGEIEHELFSKSGWTDVRMVWGVNKYIELCDKITSTLNIYKNKLDHLKSSIKSPTIDDETLSLIYKYMRLPTSYTNDISVGIITAYHILVTPIPYFKEAG
jgi:hypothetical protein